MESKRQWLFGLPVDMVSMAEAVSVCLAKLESSAGPPLRIMTLNPEMAIRACRDRALADCFRGEIVVVPDGIGISIAGWRRGWPRLSRVAGIDLCARLASKAARQSTPIFLYGGRPGVAEQAAVALARKFPGLPMGGVAHGFLSPEEQAALPARIASARARMVFVGLGVPRQELWLARNLDATGARVGMGVGGSFDVFAGWVGRAPLILRRMGLEWAYRVWREPRRWRRLSVLPIFFWHALLSARGRWSGSACPPDA